MTGHRDTETQSIDFDSTWQCERMSLCAPVPLWFVAVAVVRSAA